jgi:osmoprotectant transport system permease protein
LASLGQLIGVSSLGYFFIDGLQRDFPTEIIVGIVMIVLLAVSADLLLIGLRRILTPWQRRGTRAAPPSVLTPLQPDREAQAEAA